MNMTREWCLILWALLYFYLCHGTNADNSKFQNESVEFGKLDLTIYYG